MEDNPSQDEKYLSLEKRHFSSNVIYFIMKSFRQPDTIILKQMYIIYFIIIIFLS